MLPKRDPAANSGYGGVGFYGSSVRPSILLRPSSSSLSSPSRSCHGRTDRACHIFALSLSPPTTKRTDEDGKWGT